MKQTKKALATMAACTLIGAMAIGGTFAYLTDEEQATNTFTVGKVEIDLQEPDWDPNHPPVVPNEEVDKDPTVVNTGTNSAYAFVEVQIPMKNVTVAKANGERGTTAFQELFTWGTVSGGETNWCTNKEKGTADGIYNDWTLIEKNVPTTPASDGSKDYATYIFAYKNPIAPKAVGDSDYTKLTLFDKVKFVNVIEGDVTENVDIPVRAYAIQSDSIDTTVTDGKDGDDKLLAIYKVYAEQNKNDPISVDNADSGTLTLGNEAKKGTVTP